MPTTILGIVTSPFARLNISPPAIAWLVGIYEVCIGDILFGILLLLVASGIWDTMYGRRVAHSTNTYDSLKAEMGFHSKVMGIVLVLLVRGFEWWWAACIAGSGVDQMHTHGALAAAIAVTLFRNDIKSIQDHRMRFGQGKIPILGKILDLMDSVAVRLGAPAEKTPVVHRNTDITEQPL